MNAMKTLERILLSGFLILLWIGMQPSSATAADCDCSIGVAEPPFLSSAVDPNLLMIIDNSASMLDLAYVSSTSTCYDDSYNDSSAYAGYFNPVTWYRYDFTAEKFQTVSDTAAGTFCAASGTEYSSDYLCVDGTMTVAEMTAVSVLYATGNLLNWAAASKLDIQKEILTGGKYDSMNQRLKMESRGCGDRRFIKKVPVTYNAGTHYVTFAVRPPRGEVYTDWLDGAVYAVGDVVADQGGTLYKATTAGTSNGTSVLTDIGVQWAEYWETRWHNGIAYAVGVLVTDPSKENSIDKGRVYIALNSGTASGTGVDDDTGVDWEPYDLTHIEIFTGNATGFDNVACQAVVDELNAPNPSQGQLYQNIDACMESSRDGGSSGSADANNAFNHSIHNCWYKVRHDAWIPGSGTINSTQNACEDIYDNGINPWDLTSEDRAYVCFGRYTGDAANPIGYVGRCWNPGETSTQTCEWVCKNGKEYPVECPGANQQKYECTGEGGTTAGWDDGGYADVNTCIETAMQEFCGSIEVPEVIDPSDQVGSATGDTDVTWGLPAMLTDSGVLAQLEAPIAIMKGFIEKTSDPEGLIQEYADDIRMGAMVFNHSGSASECDQTDPYVLYSCADSGNMDGGKVIQEIGQSVAHTTNLVTAVNSIKATSWTPLAEAYYNGIGYFKQDAGIRLNADDFPIGTDPIEYWCQNNNILIITEGASTADQHPDVQILVAGENDSDTDNSGTVDCGTLDGSTFLDDLSWYAKNVAGLLGQVDGKDKRNVSTHIVAAGTPRSDGTGECSPDTLLTSAAENGGTSLVTAADMTELKAAIREAFSAIRAGAAAGSAASVISATRSGEGAVYQAIFWPEIDGPVYTDGTQKPSATWAGEVHSLLVDAHGQLFEDTNGDGALTDADQRVIFYFDKDGSPAETKACYGEIVDDACDGEIKSLHEVNYLWSAAKWLAGITDTDIVSNRSAYISMAKQRYIFTWNDLDNDGVVDKPSEIIEFVSSKDWVTDFTPTGGRGNVSADFGVTTDAEVDAIVDWVRGKDATGQRSREVDMPANFDVTVFANEANQTITWRLGDIIYSTPTVVGRPAESFHLLYQDLDYVDFVEKYKDRRQVVYFGGNDGMIHAVNGGFYNADDARYCTTAGCDETVEAPALGAELWSYVPYNLQPQLKCLTASGYTHRYYVDLKPRIFDVRIFSEDGTHPKGWGTILVAGMRLGGNPIEAGTYKDADDADVTDSRKFTSAYVIFDITNPEQPPVLLGELTYDPASSVHMGYTAAVPTVVPMKDGTGTKWYLILGSGPSGPDALKGVSNQTAKMAVFPLEDLTQSTPGPFRIPDLEPTAGSAKGRWELADTGFISDPITVDFHLDSNYRGDVVYFGTVEGDSTSGWEGKMYRVVTNADSGNTAPHQWSSPSVLYDPQRPITAAAAVGWDGYNYWVYFGTGRFFDKEDKSDTSQEFFYGIKEPVTCSDSQPSFSWATVTSNLLRTDQILVTESIFPDGATLSCPDGVDCLPDGVDSLSELILHIAGTGCSGSVPSGTAGWYQQLTDLGERNLGQATLLGGLVTFTTYEPYDDLCQPDGVSFLSAVHYQTGTASHQTSFGGPYGTTSSDPPKVASRIEIGPGLASTPNLHVGREDGAKAFVQTSTGAIIEIEEPNMPVDEIKNGRITWRNDQVYPASCE